MVRCGGAAPEVVSAAVFTRWLFRRGVSPRPAPGSGGARGAVEICAGRPAFGGADGLTWRRADSRLSPHPAARHSQPSLRSLGSAPSTSQCADAEGSPLPCRKDQHNARPLRGHHLSRAAAGLGPRTGFAGRDPVRVAVGEVCGLLVGGRNPRPNCGRTCLGDSRSALGDVEYLGCTTIRGTLPVTHSHGDVSTSVWSQVSHLKKSKRVGYAFGAPIPAGASGL